MIMVIPEICDICGAKHEGTAGRWILITEPETRKKNVVSEETTTDTDEEFTYCPSCSYKSEVKSID